MTRVRGCLPVLAALACAAPAERSSSPDGAPPFDSLLQAGEQVYYRGQYDSARSLWGTLLEHSRASGDSLAEARALTWLGLVAWRLGEYEEARSVGERALALKQRWALAEDLFKSYNALGLLAWNEARFADATHLFGQALAAAQAAGDSGGVAIASGNLGLVFFELGDFTEARRGFDTMRATGRALGDGRVEANSLTNLAMLDIRAGAPEAAVPRLRAARRLYRATAQASGEQNALAQLGTAYAALGEPGRAFAAVDTAIRIARAHGLRSELSENLEVLGALYREAGDYPRALELYTETARLKRELDLEVEAAADLRAIGEIHAKLGATDHADDLVTQALGIHRQAGARLEELDDLLLLAEVRYAAGAVGEATTLLGEAVALAHRIASPRGIAETALVTARIAERRGEHAGVLRAIQAARSALTSGGYGLEEEAHRLEMRAFIQLGRLDSAAASGRRAVAAIERVRGRYGSTWMKTSYMAERGAIYADLVDVLRRQGRTEEAMEVADAARGRMFLDHLAASRQETARGAVERSIGEEEDLLRRVSLLAEQTESSERNLRAVDDPETHAAVARLRQRLDSARAAYEARTARTAALRSPRLTVAGRHSPSVTDIRRRLRPDEAMLQFQVTGDSLLTFVLRRDGLTAAAVGVSAGRLAARLRVARDLLERSGRTGSAAPVVMDSLYELLIGPLQREGTLAGVAALILVPHGVLTYLPFAALRDPRTGRYLVEDYSLRLLPAAGALVAMRDSSSRASPELSSRAAVFAPESDGLPATAVEARAIAHTMDAERFEAGRATEPAVRRALADRWVVHLATHAHLNPTHPLFSWIRVRPDGTGSERDGRLEIHEILRMSVRSRLVFLSGCETALGTGGVSSFAPGDDYATLARAFLYAGAGGVVATLWRVEDRGAAVLAERFYQELRTAEAAEALARAQRALLRGSEYQAAYHWGGYVLSGEAALAPQIR